MRTPCFEDPPRECSVMVTVMLSTACRRSQAVRVAVKSAARAAVPVAATRIAAPAAALQPRPSLPLVGVPLGSVPWIASADAAPGASLGVESRLTCAVLRACCQSNGILRRSPTYAAVGVRFMSSLPSHVELGMCCQG